MEILNSLAPFFINPFEREALEETTEDTPYEDAELADKDDDGLPEQSSPTAPDLIVDLNSTPKTLEDTEVVSQPSPSTNKDNPLLSRIASLYNRLQSETIQDFAQAPKLDTQEIIKGRSEISQSSLSQFDLVMRTAEGDVINLSIYQNSNAYSDQSYDAGRGFYQESNFFSTTSGFEFTVQGDLNAEEQAAVASFLEEVTSLTDAFLDYDLPSVLDAVDNLSLSPELSGFALNLKTAYAERVSQAITTAPTSSSSNSNNKVFNPAQALGNFRQNITDALPEQPSPMNKANLLDAYARDLLDDVTALMEQAKDASERFKERFENQFLEKLPGFITDQWQLNQPTSEDDD